MKSDRSILHSVEKVLLVLVLIVTLLSVVGTYYKYVVLSDFAVDSKPMEDFTDEDF